MNILIAIESFYDGGAEIFAIRLANELSLNQNVFFLELYPYSTKEKRQLALLDVNRIKLIQPGKSLFGDWIFKKVSNENFHTNTSNTLSINLYNLYKKIVLKRFIKSNRIEIVNSHSWDSDWYFARLKNELNVKLIASFHGHYEYLANKKPAFTTKTKFLLRVADMIVYTTSSHLRTLNEFKFPESKIKKIFYGVNMPLSGHITNYQNGDRLDLILVARGIEEKGWYEAIIAVLQLQKKYPGMVLLNLVGEGKFLDEMKMKFSDDAIKYLGYKEDIQAIVATAHIGILPTYYIAESLPNSVIEYLMCGKPVIATNVGAIKEMISYEAEQAGVCINLQEGKVNVEELAMTIETYINTPGLVNKHSAIALKAAEKFTMKVCVEKYLEAYEKLLS